MQLSQNSDAFPENENQNSTKGYSKEQFVVSNLAPHLLDGLWNAAQHIRKNVGVDPWQRLACPSTASVIRSTTGALGCDAAETHGAAKMNHTCRGQI